MFEKFGMTHDFFQLTTLLAVEQRSSLPDVVGSSFLLVVSYSFDEDGEDPAQMTS